MNYFDILLARKLKGGGGGGYNLKTASGDIVTIRNGVALPMPSLTVGIEAVQAGSGDPSPTNVRPISGWSAVNVVVSPTTDAEDGTTYTTALKDGQGNPMECYGGTLDVVSGELVVDRTIVDLGTLNWIYNSKYNLFAVEFPAQKMGIDGGVSICSAYVNYNGNSISDDNFPNDSFWYKNWGLTRNNILIKDIRYTDATLFKQAVSGVQYCYTLATPITIQLTPTAVKSLLGTNNIWADSGDITVKALDKIIQG